MAAERTVLWWRRIFLDRRVGEPSPAVHSFTDIIPEWRTLLLRQYLTKHLQSERNDGHWIPPTRRKRTTSVKYSRVSTLTKLCMCRLKSFRQVSFLSKLLLELLFGKYFQLISSHTLNMYASQMDPSWGLGLCSGPKWPLRCNTRRSIWKWMNIQQQQHGGDDTAQI